MHYDFIEIGTSDYDTLIANADISSTGICVEPVGDYLERLPNLPNVKKIQAIISPDDSEGHAEIFYVPASQMDQLTDLPIYVRGCNKVGEIHEQHKIFNLEDKVQRTTVKKIPIIKLFQDNQVTSVTILKLDTEGHDSNILINLFPYLLNFNIRPKTIIFESNVLTPVEKINKVKKLYAQIGYQSSSTSDDTTMIFKPKVVIVTGGFDPIHSGHISYINSAKKLGDFLLIGLNSDQWLKRKKGQAFLPFVERKCILENLNKVDKVIQINDSDGSASDAIAQALIRYPNCEIVFANGGDRGKDNTPEQIKYQDNPLVTFVFGVGGEDKKNSSSWILEKWKSNKTSRPWGHYEVFYTNDQSTVKVKKLVLEPGKYISMQYHNDRSEFWHVEKGVAAIYSQTGNEFKLIKEISIGQQCSIDPGTWHQVKNIGQEDLHIIEIQYGSRCEESDIVRLN